MSYKHLLTAAYFIIILTVLNSCNNSGDEVDPCLSNPPEVKIDNITKSIIGKSSGEIVVSAIGGSEPYMFSIDGTNFQGSGIFDNLSAGDYTISVRDINDCSGTKLVKIEELAEVFYANEIRPIIDTNCQKSGCHGSNSSIPTFATYDDVKAKASSIKARTSAKSMPPAGPLSDSNIKLIADWVDQGAPNN